MIYIIGDRHGDENGFTDDALPGQSMWTYEDIVIVCGDFGYVFLGGDRDVNEKRKLDELSKKPYRILFCDGNHEGFDYLVQYPEEECFGAPVRKIRDNIFWLQRGCIYNIQGKSFFVMGGAYSTDFAYRMSYENYYGRKIWFSQELPKKEEYQRASASLKEHDFKVDYIITHTAPCSLIPDIIHKEPDHHDAELTNFLDRVYHETEFTKWYCGHFHEDMEINDQFTVCYETVHIIS